MTLSLSAKSRLERQQRDIISALEGRLLSCKVEDINRVKESLEQARQDLVVLSSIAVKPRKTKSVKTHP